MYTQCPDCSTSFRVTATDLKQAAGKVRCGGCGSAFDALEFLSETMPEQPTGKKSARRLPELKPDRPDTGLPDAVSPQESIALLKTLDELAGSDIRIEDTGIEWRVLDDQVIADLETADDADASGEADNEAQPDVTRYDDDTPMSGENDDGDASPAPDTEIPNEEAPDDQTESDPDGIQAEVDVDFGDDETDDWDEILEEVGDNNKPDVVDETNEGADEQLPEPADELAGEELSGSDDDDTTESDDDGGGRNEDHENETHTGEETDDDNEPLPEVQEVDTAFESIIMEGETVRNALDDLAEGAQPTDADITYWTPPEESMAPNRSAARKFGLAAAAFVLLLVLGLQVVHYYRETLATIPAVQKIIGPAYRVIGLPLSPDWDVTGWRFEATQGSANDETDELTVFSRIGNTTDKPLPYPLIGISLTDRFDETVGSRLLAPAQFLTGDTNPRKLVPAGATFDAVISIRSPDESATGYKLNVCYRDATGASHGQLRCAIGDFKE